MRNIKNNDYSVKNRIGNLLFVIYISLYVFLLILRIPNDSVTMKIIFIIGAVIGFSVKVIIVILFWKTVMTKYIKKDKKISIIRLIIGALLIMLALFPITQLSDNFIETYIVISIVIILKNDYQLFSETEDI